MAEAETKYTSVDEKATLADLACARGGLNGPVESSDRQVVELEEAIKPLFDTKQLSC